MIRNSKLLLFIFLIVVISVGITQARYSKVENITGNIKVYGYDFCQQNNIVKLSECIIVMENPELYFNEGRTSVENYIKSKTYSTNSIMPSSEFEEVKSSLKSVNISTLAHFTFGKSYSFNKDTGIYTLIDYVNDSNVNNYKDYYTCGATTSTLNSCTTMYKVGSSMTENTAGGTKYTIVSAYEYTYRIKGILDSQAGLYAANDNQGTSYFYRGAVDNNYISFAGHIWRIVRKNGNGSVRIIYAGNSIYATGNETTIGSSAFNTKYHDPTYIGYKYSENFILSENDISETNWLNFMSNVYMYFSDSYTFNENAKKFTLSGNMLVNTWIEKHDEIIQKYPYTCLSGSKNWECDVLLRVVGYNGDNSMQVQIVSYSSKNYLDTLNNTTSSTIKSQIDSWYLNNLKNYDLYLDKDATFCNDRTIISGTGYKLTSTSLYGAYNRLLNTKKANLVCNQSSDQLSVSNNNLEYPIALITTDEVNLAGGMFNSVNNQYYLYTGDNYYTMSPSDYTSYGGTAGMWYVTATGSLNAGYVGAIYGIRPVINLKSDVEIIRGTGTADDPYVITE